MARNKSIHAKSLRRLSTSCVNNDISNNYNDKRILKLLDSINVRIISELVKNPTISSLSLAKRLDIPLSTLQRRRAKIENAILRRTYTFNYKAFGGRVGDFIIHVDKGKSDEVAQILLKKYKNNIAYCDTRINSMHNVSAHVVYKNTEELHNLIESIRSMDYVTGVASSETVRTVGDNNSEVILAFFNGK